ncbi:MAG: helix-turn-helix transcriptional regulator [Bacteroidales bacterium]|nr:helix-turn-helix transcriptional regulator [Bacteroidales bacterium]
MESIYLLLLFLPVFACFFWTVLSFFLSRRTTTFWILTIISVVLMMYFFADAIYATPGRSTHIVVYSPLISIISGPSFIPLLAMYFDRIHRHSRFTIVQYIWVLLPIALFFATFALTSFMGVDAVAAFLERLYAEGPGIVPEYKGRLEWDYFWWASAGYRIVVGAEFLVGMVYLISFLIRNKIRLSNLWGYLFKGQSISVVELQLSTLVIAGLYILSKVFFFKDVFDERPLIAVIQSLLVTTWYFLFMLCSLLGEKDRVTRVQASHIMFYNYNPSIKGPIIDILMEELVDESEPESLVRLQERIGASLQSDRISSVEMATVKEKLYSTASGTWDDSLVSRFQNLMANEKLFLQPSLSLGDIAEKLRTNKTYISKLVNNTYNLSFPDLLNMLRIDYAQKYLIKHRDAKQDEIAKACGFLSASSFNSVFRKITGVTPKMWLAAKDRK